MASILIFAVPSRDSIFCNFCSMLSSALVVEAVMEDISDV